LRYPVCAREEGAPTLSRLRLSNTGPELWALHCGPSVHLLAIEREGEHLVPRRVARMQARSYNPAEAPRAVPVTAADIDGDGRADLIVPVLLVDRAGTPAGGALYRLRGREQGGFDPATRLLDLAPGGAAAATLDAEPGMDLLLLHLRDPHTAQPNQLWLVRGGPAPLRIAQLEAGSGSASLAVADLDRDGIDDAAVASESEGRVRLWLSSHGPAAKSPPIVLELPGVREVLAGDLDGDGQRDLLLAGEGVWFLLARQGFAADPKLIAGSEHLRDVQLEDANADGKLDVVGYVHPDVIALVQGDQLRFTRRTLASLRGDLGVLFTRIGQLDANTQPDLVIATTSEGPDAQLELAIASNLTDAAPVRFAAKPQTLRDAVLLQHFALP
jgi:hypothetical protein